MIVVVTGSNGFIGSHLVEALLQQDYHIRCLDIQEARGQSAQDTRIEHYTVDCGDLDALRQTQVFEGVDYVFHLAGVSKRVKLEEFRCGNVVTTGNVLQVLVEKNVRIKRFVYISTQAAAGPASSLDHPVTELSEPKPIENYGISKLEAEHVVRELAARLPVTILRPGTVYGPRDVDFLAVFKQISKHLSVYPAYRTKYVNILFITDLVRGMLQAARAPEAIGKTYFLCADDPVMWQDIHQGIARVQNKKVFEINIPQCVVDLIAKVLRDYSKITGYSGLVNSEKIALSRPKFWVCSPERAKRDFGFETRVPLLQGLETTYRWYVENGWL